MSGKYIHNIDYYNIYSEYKYLLLAEQLKLVFLFVLFFAVTYIKVFLI